MPNKLKIAIVWEWERAKEIEKNWRDGLRACIENLSKEHLVDFLLFESPQKQYDWIITWCDSNSNFSHYFFKSPAKRGIFLTTHPSNYHNLQGFDVVFCESQPIYEECRQYGIHAVRAFGTDEKFFHPGNLEKDIEYFSPGTFSPWKRQQDIAHLGSKLTCVGTVQPDGHQEYEACLREGVHCEVGYFPPEKILNYYQRSKNVILPAVHGSERSVLEAMACNILPLVTNPTNKTASSYLKEFEESGLKTPREFIKKFYSGEKYASNVLKGLHECED